MADERLTKFGLDDDVDGDDAGWLERVRAAEDAAPLGTLGGFSLVEEVGSGGQGIVYRALDDRTGRCVALKHLHAGLLAGGAARQRFEREVEAAAALDHPDVVTLYSRETVDGVSVVAMEWVDGVPINQWALDRASPRDPRDIIVVFARVCEAVAHAHQRGVIHRDLKPSNILVDGDDRPHVLDFGIAKLDTQFGAAPLLLTQSGQFMGTPAYASPEQARGDADAVDVRSDVYAIGVMLYEALTNAMPYDVDAPLVDVLTAIGDTLPPRPSSHRPGLGREIDAVVLKTLAKDPAARYQSAHELARDLERVAAGEPVEARTQGAWERLAYLAVRHRAAVAGVAMAALLVIGYIVVMPLLYRSASREAERTQRVKQFLEETLASASPYQAGGEQTVVHMLDAAAARLAEYDFADDPAVAADLHHAIAQAYAGLWLWGRAEVHADKAIAALRRVHGGDHPELADCLNLRARSLAFKDDPRAIDAVQDAIDMRRRLYGAAHPALAESLSSSGFALWKLRGMDAADAIERAYRSGLDMYEQTATEATVPWARSHYSFASFSRNRGQLDVAEHHFARALEMYRGFEGETFYLARVLTGYAACLMDLGRHADAEPMLREALSLHPPGYEDDAVRTTRSLLASFEDEQKR